MVTHEGYTMMRPLVMDFQATTPMFRHRQPIHVRPGADGVSGDPAPVRRIAMSIFRPEHSWYGFLDRRKSYPAARRSMPRRRLKPLPLFVRAGSIIPYGPAIQYAMQTNDPIELRVYRGADGTFTLYEDEGDNYDYEKGKYATIPISWNEAKRTLEIGKRSGEFPGMLKERTFNVVWISDNHGAGISSTEKPDAVVHYHGAAVEISGPQ